VKLERNLIDTMTISDFADEHDLVMVITERPGRSNEHDRFYAMFKGAEVLEGTNILRGEFGNGYTETQAIREYGFAISNRTLVIDAMGPKRRKIQVPTLTF